MTRIVGRLVAVGLDKKPPGMHADGGGLYLHVSKSGGRSWILRYMLDGRAREMGLGPLALVPLKQARELAIENRRRVRLDGKDPIDERRATRAKAKLDVANGITFKACAHRYIAAHRAGWKNDKHAAQWPSTLETYVYPICGALPVQAIDTGLVMQVLEQQIDGGRGKKPVSLWLGRPETASRVRARIESVLDYAKVRGWRTGDNSAVWRGHLDKMLLAPSKAKRAKRRATGRGEHHAALPYDEIAPFMAALRGRAAISARALEFTILTAKRTEEVIGGRWKEIDGDLWTIPAGRMKGEREHRVSLSAAALTVLEAMRDLGGEGDDFVFPGPRAGRPLSNMAMLTLLQKRMQLPQFTVHGFRSTFRDWAAECTAFPAEVAEMALAHVVDDKTEAAYRRDDLLEKRRRLMEAWSAFCAGGAPIGEVIPLRAAVEA
jgi:integrase